MGRGRRAAERENGTAALSRAAGANGLTRTRRAPWAAWPREHWPVGAFLAIVIVLWELLVVAFDVPKYLLPRPSQVAAALAAAAGPLFAEHTPWTLMETGLGLLLAVGAGLGIGCLVHFSGFARRALYPLLVASQTVPLIVLAPLLVVWFGYGIFPKLLIVAITCFFPVAVAVVDGLDGADPEKIKLVKAMGASRYQQFRLVTVPSAMGSFFTGLRVAATYGVMAAVIAEWMGSDRGLGMFIVRSARSFRTEYVFAGILVVTAFSMAAFLLVGLVRRLALPWERYVTARGERRPGDAAPAERAAKAAE